MVRDRTTVLDVRRGYYTMGYDHGLRGCLAFFHRNGQRYTAKANNVAYAKGYEKGRMAREQLYNPHVVMTSSQRSNIRRP
jgi:hypothetical protein